MLPGVKLATSWSPVGCASNWAIKASFGMGKVSSGHSGQWRSRSAYAASIESDQGVHYSFEFVWRFYGPVNPMGSSGARSVYLTTCLLGRLSPLLAVNQYCAHSFARNWQLPFLNQQKGENDCRKYFNYQSPQKNVADLGGGRTRNLLVSSRTRIQLSHRGRHHYSFTESLDPAVEYGNCPKILYTKVFDKIAYANSADPDQEQSDLSLHCLPSQ